MLGHLKQRRHNITGKAEGEANTIRREGVANVLGDHVGTKAATYFR